MHPFHPLLSDLQLTLKSTWPAVWVLGADWPTEGTEQEAECMRLGYLIVLSTPRSLGEVDILEGVNDVSPDQATLHTSPGACDKKHCN